MQHTMNLLDAALAQQPAPYWHEKLQLSRNALHNARMRGHVSPAIAGALAEELGQDAKEWIVVAALESERDSACKERMIRRLRTAAKSFFSHITRQRRYTDRQQAASAHILDDPGFARAR